MPKAESEMSFEEWVKWWFDREPYIKDHFGHRAHWYHDFDNEVDWSVLPNDSVQCEYISQLFESSTELLRPYAAEQIGVTLWDWFDSESIAFFGGGPSDTRSIFERLRPLRALVLFVKDVCESRYPITNEMREHPLYFVNGTDALTGAMYMYWDICSNIWIEDENEFYGRRRHPKYLEAAFNEMEATLFLGHPIAQVHALHGIGHYQDGHEQWAADLIDRFLTSTPDISDQLHTYAMQARDGTVQ